MPSKSSLRRRIDALETRRARLSKGYRAVYCEGDSEPEIFFDCEGNARHRSEIPTDGSAICIVRRILEPVIQKEII